jgi:hypothetical protein
VHFLYMEMKKCTHDYFFYCIPKEASVKYIYVPAV